MLRGGRGTQLIPVGHFLHDVPFHAEREERLLPIL